MNTRRSTPWTLALAAPLALAGCGVRLVTVKDAQGRDLMLPGNDPAYFAQGKPVKGDPALVAEHDGVWYCFSRPEHRAMFAVNRWPPSSAGSWAHPLSRIRAGGRPGEGDVTTRRAKSWLVIGCLG